MKDNNFQIMNISKKKINSKNIKNEIEKEINKDEIKDKNIEFINDEGKYIIDKKNLCKKKECKRRAYTIYKCSYCMMSYCRVHRMPEVHSCLCIDKCISNAIKKHSEKLKKCKILKNKI
ncbi:hypothetical protein DMUE_0613 [Dictyocoela muelleri]|nr:hypothetical protein DMUE_0613 [Dictyocoela muelleri]